MSTRSPYLSAYVLPALIAVNLAATAQQPAPAPSQKAVAFAGTYSTHIGGRLTEVFRVAKQNDGYHLSSKLSGNWSDDGKLRPADADEYRSLLGRNWQSLKPEGLSNGFVMIVYIPRGTIVEGVKCETGIIGFSLAGVWALQKR